MLDISGTVVNGDPSNRLPNTCNISFSEVEGQMVMESLAKEIALATGSACNADLVEPSHVLKQMGLSPDRITGSVRISLGRFTTDEEIEIAGNRLTEVVTELCYS